MADTSSLISLKDLTNRILFKQRREEDDYPYVLQGVIDAYRDLRLYHVGQYKTVKIEMDSLRMIDFPSDYIDLVSVGHAEAGKFWSYTQERNLITTTTIVDDEDTQDSEAGEGVNIATSQWSGLSARGGNNKYYYKEDLENRRFVFNGGVAREVILTYMSSGTNDTDTTYIPFQYVPVIEMQVAYEMSLFDNTAVNKAGLYEAQYRKEREKIRFLEMPSLDVIRDEIYKSMNLTARR